MGTVTARGEVCTAAPRRLLRDPPRSPKTFGLGGRHTRITFPLALARRRGEESALRAPDRAPTTAGIDADFLVTVSPPPSFSTERRGGGLGPLIEALAALLEVTARWRSGHG